MLPPATPSAMVVSSTTDRSDDDPDDVVMSYDIDQTSSVPSQVAPSPEQQQAHAEQHVDHYASMQGYVPYDAHQVSQNALHSQQNLQNLQMYLQQEAAAYSQSISSSAAAAAASTSYLSNTHHVASHSHHLQFQPTAPSELDAVHHHHYHHQHVSFHDDLMRRSTQR